MNSHPVLPFDARTLARTSNPETSHAAARACRELRGRQHEAILAVLTVQRGLGGPPMTACEVSLASQLLEPSGRMDKHQVGRRCIELVREGYIEVADELGETDTGRKARRYRLGGRD